MEILLITILITIIADFFIQSDYTVELRNNSSIKNMMKGHKRHTFEILIPLILFLVIPYSTKNNFTNILMYISLITILHIIIDILKCMFLENLKSSTAFLFDQFIHLVINFSIWNKFIFEYNSLIYNIDKGIIYKILILIIILIYVVRGGELFIDLFMNDLFIKPNIKRNSQFKFGQLSLKQNKGIRQPDIAATTENNMSLEDITQSSSSRYIGILERFIIVVLVINGMYEAIGLLITGKSIARTREFKDKDFATKYIVGTFLSMLIGIIGGETFKFIVKYILVN